LTRITPPICILDLLSLTGGNRHDTSPAGRNPFRIASGVDAEEVRVAGVTFDRVTKTYADGTTAVHELDLDITDGEFMVLVGPSGCGKTTALRMVAGLEDISRGVLKIGERVVNHVPSRDRDIAMVFQSYALYPHLTVYDNIAFGLKIKGLPKAEIDKRVQNAARILGLDPFLKRKPRALSGGQRQRVAMGRAIVREPAAFLMDEPLSNLDAKLRVQMRAEIAGLQHDLGVTTIYVTHDQVEAMTMGDRVAVMRKGELQQVADPQTLYDRPVNLFVGGFIGSPAMNMVEATLQRQNGGFVAKVGEQTIAIEQEEVKARPGLAAYDGKQIVLGIRPEDLEDAALASGTTTATHLRGETELTEALGSEIMVHFSIKARHAMTEDVRELAEDVGDERAIDQSAEDTATLVGRFGARSRVRPGQPIEVAVDTRSLHFFDPQTGLGIYDGTGSTKGAE
jgi:multiple sugar transport system ATP-binding protein